MTCRDVVVWMLLIAACGSRPSATLQERPSAGIRRADPVRFVPQLGHAHHGIGQLSGKVLDTVAHLDVSKDGRYVVTTGGGARVWEVESGAIVQHVSIREHDTVRFVGTSYRIANGLESFDGVTGERIAVPVVIPARDLTGFTLSADGTRAAGFGNKRRVVWELTTGKVLLDSAERNFQETATFSPDGKIIAFGNPSSIQLVDLSTGTMTKEVPTSGSGEHRGLLSPDGRVVADVQLNTYTDNDDEPVPVEATIVDLATSQRRPIPTPNGLYAAHFLRDGKLVLADHDAIRIWDVASHRALHTWQAKARHVAVAGDGSTIVSTDRFGEVTVWDVTGRIIHQFGAKPLANSVAVRFSPDGTRLVVGSQSNLTSWDLAGLRVDRVLDAGRRAELVRFLDVTTVVAMTQRPGTIYSTRSDSEMTRFDLRTGRVQGATRGAMPNEPGMVEVTWVSPDGRDTCESLPRRTKCSDTISGGQRWRIEGKRFNFAGRLADGSFVTFTTDRTEPPLAVRDATTGAIVRTFGTPELAGSIARAVVAPDGRRIALSTCCRRETIEVWDASTGTRERELDDHFASSLQWASAARLVTVTREGDVTAWDVSTGKRAWSAAALGSIAELAASPDGKLIAGTLGGTVRLWRVDDGRSIALVSSGSEWLVYDDEGHFDASKDGRALVVAVENGRAYQIDQLAIRNNRPDLLLERMGLGTADAIRNFRTRAEQRLEQRGLAAARLATSFADAPNARILDARVAGKRMTIVAELAAAGDSELKTYNVWANGVPLLGTEGKRISGAATRVTETIELATGDNRIEVGAFANNGVESLRPFRIARYDGSAPAGDLYYLAFGVSKYRDSRIDLEFAHKDVLDLGDLLRAAPGFGRVHVKTYTDAEVTVGAIGAAKSFLATTKVDDTVIVFVAGHGIHARDAGGKYFFATHAVSLDDLPRTAAPFELVEELLQNIAARHKLFLMDTCESGELEPHELAGAIGSSTGARGLRSRALTRVDAKPAPTGPAAASPRIPELPVRLPAYLLDRDRYIYMDLVRRSGAVVLASSRGTEDSFELAELRNGAFTESILRVLSGLVDADGDRNQRVSTAELVRALASDVPQFTANLQHPTIDHDNLDAKISFPVVPNSREIVAR